MKGELLRERGIQLVRFAADLRLVRIVVHPSEALGHDCVAPIGHRVRARARRLARDAEMLLTDARSSGGRETCHVLGPP